SAAKAAIAGFGEGTPQQVSREGQNRRIADFGTVVETCSKTAADCPCLVFPYIERTGQGLRPAVGGLFSFRQYDAGTGLCCPLAAAFSLSAKDTFQRPPTARWTRISQNFFCLSNPGTGILATGGTEKFCFYFLQRRDFENAKYPGGKISPLIYYYNRQGAKWPGARTGNKKSSKSFS